MTQKFYFIGFFFVCLFYFDMGVQLFKSQKWKLAESQGEVGIDTLGSTQQINRTNKTEHY